MAYDLTEINLRTVKDPKEFCAECEEGYNKKVKRAAKLIAENLTKSPIVLLSGPSGSGKTTTSVKISEELEKLGIGTHYVAMDDYFLTVTPETTPRTPEGDYDLESPLCLDMKLLRKHFAELTEGKRIFVPKYEFSRQMRETTPSKSIRLKKDEICIFEGIHALNDEIAGSFPEAFKLYVSAKSTVGLGGNTVFKNTWFRLVRRLVRDNSFRGTEPEETMKMWANVRRGEKLYISPYKEKADYQLDTVLACEAPVLNRRATEMFRSIPEGIERYDELRAVLPALQLFGEIGEECVSEDSLLREFIGGGIYG